MHYTTLSFLALSAIAAATNPSIVIVPGAWQIEPSWELFRGYLTNAGYDVAQVALPSVGTSLTGLDTDVNATHAILDPLLADGKDVVVLCHSLGGLVAANAVEGRDIASRSAEGLAGGVIQLIYLAAFMAPAGYSLFNLMGNAWFDWMVVEDGKVTGNTTDMLEIGFNDLPTSVAEEYASYMTWTSEQVFTDAAEFAPWTDASITESYIHTLLDNALPYASQLAMASLLLPSASAVYSINSSHVPFISHPAELLALVEEAVEVGVDAASAYVGRRSVAKGGMGGKM